MTLRRTSPATLPYLWALLLCLAPAARADFSSRVRSGNCSLTARITVFDGTTPTSSEAFDFTDGPRVRASGGWEVACSTAAVADRPEAVDVFVRFRLLSGSADETNTAVELSFGHWSTHNYVLFPGAVYDGNRFTISGYPCYPPFIENASDHRLDLPITITRNPHLLQGAGTSMIEQTTGDLATPCMGFHSPSTAKGFLLLTPQQTRFGNSGLTVVESGHRGSAVFTVSAPHVRKKRANMCGLVDSDDRGASWAAGDHVTIHVRLYFFDAPALRDLFTEFSRIRKDLWPGHTPNTILPLSKAVELAEAKWNRDNWYEQGSTGFYNIEGNTGAKSLGWCGDGCVTHAMLMSGTDQSRERALRTIEMYLPECVSPSGLFNTFYTGSEWIGDACRQNHSTWRDLSLSRRHGEVLFFLLKQVDLLTKQDESWTPPAQWIDALRSQADALCEVWNTDGQFGNWIDCRTGTVSIGGTTSGASIPAALALASDYFDSTAYLSVAEQAARYYYEHHVARGLTTGGPGDALQSPDCESAIHMLESFVTLYELTDRTEWLDYARDMGRLFSTWITSYNYVFPSASTFAQLDMRTLGACWANTQNKCAVPALCTISGDCLWKLYRATGDSLFMTLIRDLARGIPQYLSRTDRPISGMGSGMICERVQMGDWESWCPVGETFGRSSPWVEAALMMTYAEIPGVYAICDKEEVWVADNITAEVLASEQKRIKLKLTNPTEFPASIRAFVETSSQQSTPLGINAMLECRKVDLAEHQSTEVWLDAVGTTTTAGQQHHHTTTDPAPAPEPIIINRNGLVQVKGARGSIPAKMRITDLSGKVVASGGEIDGLRLGRGVYAVDGQLGRLDRKVVVVGKEVQRQGD